MAAIHSFFILAVHFEAVLKDKLDFFQKIIATKIQRHQEIVLFFEPLCLRGRIKI